MDPFVGEIRLISSGYAPTDWLYCEGQILSTQEYQVLYSVIGNLYGGSSPNTFALPDLRMRTPICFGTGAGLTPRKINDANPLTDNVAEVDNGQMPNHDHTALATQAIANATSAKNNTWANTAVRPAIPAYATAADTQMHPKALAGEGGGAPHNNMQPYLQMSYIIATVGIYPVKS